MRFLAEYASDYEIESLKKKCEMHLKYCHEISLIDRLITAFDYEMEDAKVSVMGIWSELCNGFLGGPNLRPIFSGS